MASRRSLCLVWPLFDFLAEESLSTSADSSRALLTLLDWPLTLWCPDNQRGTGSGDEMSTKYIDTLTGSVNTGLTNTDLHHALLATSCTGLLLYTVPSIIPVRPGRVIQVSDTSLIATGRYRALHTRLCISLCTHHCSEID